MIVEPYKLHPVAPTIALVTADGRAISEHGEILDLDDWPAGTRAFCSYDTARELLLDGQGEALCWNREEIRWRHRRLEDGWKRRASDVNVLKLPFPDDVTACLTALTGWRDWLASYRAAPTGTSGASSWSLLRSTLLQTLWTTVGEGPPLRATIGGRQELGPAGQGRFEGILEQVDLPAAYATELGHLRYGGRWIRAEDAPIKHDPEWWAQGGRCIFVRAVVEIPDLPYGPLPRRARKPQTGFLRSTLLGTDYPTGCRLQGVWTWQELETAVTHGARILRILDTWVHIAGDSEPFAYWWQAVCKGREMPGLAGLLAKVTGNALWGRFCMDSRAAGERSVMSRRPNGKHLDQRILPLRPMPPPAHDLAETISGRVRARLYNLMMTAGENLVSCHTDGAWLQGALEPPEGWRVKGAARRLDLLDPQVIRYWPRPPRRSEPWVVFSGVPSRQADAAFAAAWERAGMDGSEQDTA